MAVYLAGRHLPESTTRRRDCLDRRVTAVAANTDDRKEVIGLDVGASKAEPYWVELLRGLHTRGLVGEKLVISNAYGVLRNAIERLCETSWQAAASIGCATPWPLRSARHLTNPTAQLPERCIVRSQINFIRDDPNLPLSWMTTSTEVWPA